MKENGQGQTSATEGGGEGADYCQLLQFKAATINKDVVTDRLAAAVKNTQHSTMKK